MSAVEIAGRYRLEGRLGFGGMSTVHLALDLRLERQVAVKLLAEHLADDPTFVSRFQREAQAAARLVHPNIVQVFDSGHDERTGQYFIVMEYIEGSSCAEILRDDGWVEVDEALSIIEQACEGLHYAHRHGVVHRDVKPGNLLRAREGEVKLADFGIAKATEQSSITQVGSVLGTAAYLAPEQARGEEAGPQRRPVRARRRHLPADLRAPAVRGDVADRAGAQAAAGGAADARHAVAAVTPELPTRSRSRSRSTRATATRRAREMGRALSDGARGIAPARQRPARRRLPPRRRRSLLTSTRGAAGARDVERAGTAASAVTPRRPRAGPPRQGPRRGAGGPLRAPHRAVAPAPRGRRLLVAAARAARARRRDRRGRRADDRPAPTKVVLRNVVYSDVHEASSALKQLVSENTK